MQEYKIEYLKMGEMNVWSGKYVSEETEVLEEKVNELAAEGWKLVSTENISYAGTTIHVAMFFSRQANALEELV